MTDQIRYGIGRSAHADVNGSRHPDSGLSGALRAAGWLLVGAAGEETPPALRRVDLDPRHEGRGTFGGNTPSDSTPFYEGPSGCSSVDHLGLFASARRGHSLGISQSPQMEPYHIGGRDLRSLL